MGKKFCFKSAYIPSQKKIVTTKKNNITAQNLHKETYYKLYNLSII